MHGSLFERGHHALRSPCALLRRKSTEYATFLSHQVLRTLFGAAFSPHRRLSAACSQLTAAMTRL